MNRQKELAKELHKPVRKRFPRERVRVYKNDEIWAADLVDMGAKVDDGNKFILTIIDIHSRFAWAFPIKTKAGKNVARAFKMIKNKPELLWVDKGSEFYNKEVKGVLKSTKIYSTESGMKSVYVERFNRTLKRMMWEKFTELQNEKWVSMLPELVKKYNNTVHTSTNMKPVDVYENKKELVYEVIWEREIKPKYKAGDYVRISRARGIFEKGYTQGWTHEVFKIIKVHTGNPPTYDLEDLKGETIKGKFYEPELQKTNLKDYAMIEKILQKKGNKVLVKYVGYGNEFNEWINKSQLKDI